MLRAILILCLLTLSSLVHAEEPLPPIPPIKRVLPPEGIELPKEESQKLAARLAAITKRIEPNQKHENAPDVEIFTKAIRFALDLHEFYDAKKDIAKAHKLLDEAERRVAELEQNAAKPSWANNFSGLVVRGYRSGIDNSVQPYGIVFPENFDPIKQPKMPVYVWLHGRGDKATDMHFIQERMTQVGQLGSVNAIVLHPFGRQCVGFKSAGERDVLDVLEEFNRRYKSLGVEVVPQRTVLIGFSMGGAGAWHIGAHYHYLFGAISPGAGFAETAQYTKTDPTAVPWYERKLWGMYDVPCYTRNFFNTQVIAYSGENDKQIQAARVMEAAFKAEGRELTHLIGPGVEHKYEPNTLAELKRRLEEITSKDAPPSYPRKIFLQTRTSKYGTFFEKDGFRLRIDSLEQNWEDCRIEMETKKEPDLSVHLKTKNVLSLTIHHAEMKALQVDDQAIPVSNVSIEIEKKNGKWQKSPLLKPFTPIFDHGPIDAAFKHEFILVVPTGKSKHPLVQRWVEFEMQHFIDRWRSLMRGDIRMIKDVDLDQDKIGFANLVCFGDPDSNAIIRRHHLRLPIRWHEHQIEAGPHSWPAESHVPAMIYPISSAPFKSKGCLVINSGLTFREAHDKTNSQQNPKLPDWAVIDLTQLPDDKSPGRIAAAGFFNEEWNYQPPPKE